MSNGSIAMPLSGSVGGAPIKLDVAALPGKTIHANPADSGGNDIVQNILIGNPNPNQITLLVQTSGPGITTPEAIRIDVPPTAEGTEVRLFYTPFLLAPGFTYSIAAQLQEGNKEPYLYGYVERHAASSFAGYGGIYTSVSTPLANLMTGTWAKIPAQQNAVAVPKSVIQNVANASLQVEIPGVWVVSAHMTLTFTKKNSDRILYLRFWDETAGVEVSDSPWPLYVEQNDTGGSWTVPAMPTDVAQAIINHEIIMQISTTEDFLGLSLEKSGLAFYLLDPAL